VYILNFSDSTLKISIAATFLILYLETIFHTKYSGQNNGNTKKLRNRIYVGYPERNSVGNMECSSVF
jgi:hypothetical protein